MPRTAPSITGLKTCIPASKEIFLAQDGTIYYWAKNVHPGYKGNFRIFSDPLEFLAEALQHVAPKNFQMIRYYGAYSNVIRSRKSQNPSDAEQITFPFMPLDTSLRVPSSVRKSWARLIHKIYEINPMLCPICGAKMKIQKIAAKPEQIYSTLSALGIPTQTRGQPLHPSIPAGEDIQTARNFTDYILLPDGDPFYEDTNFSYE